MIEKHATVSQSTSDDSAAHAQRSRQVVLEFYERLARDDSRVFDDLVHETFVNHAAASQGRDGFREVLMRIRDDFADHRVEIHRTVAEADLVTVHMTVKGVHRASTLPVIAGIEPTGRPVAVDFIHIFRVNTGALVEHWACRDELGLLRQLDAPTPW